MTNGFKRLTALLLALALSLSMLPCGALAAAPEGETEDTAASVTEAAEPDDLPEEQAEPEPEPEAEPEPESEPEQEPEAEAEAETPEDPEAPEAPEAPEEPEDAPEPAVAVAPEEEPEAPADGAEQADPPAEEELPADPETPTAEAAVEKGKASAEPSRKVKQVSAPAVYYNFDNDAGLNDPWYEDEESPELDAVAPNVKVTYGLSDTVTAGSIRYVSQNPNGSHYHEGYWSEPGDKTKVLCTSANVSMMLSYLGINRLPKNLGRDSVSKDKEWDGAIPEDGLSFYKAMDNYLNGEGLFSPPMIRIKSDAYSTKQHFAIVIRQTEKNKYEALDPFNRGFYMDTGIWPMETNGDEFSFYRKGTQYWTTFDDVYQFHREQATRLVNASQPGNMRQGASFTPEGKLYGSKDITAVQVGCYDMLGRKQAVCFQEVEPGCVGYDLSKLDGALRFDRLKPGFYRYQVKASTAGGAMKTYLTKDFTVLAKDRTVRNATFSLNTFCDTGYCVAPKGKSKLDTARIVLARNTNLPVFRFQAVYVGNGYYKLRDVGSNSYLTVYRSKNVPGTHLIQYKMIKRPGQYWQILHNGKGGFYLVPKCAPDCCLTLNKSSVREGAPLSIRKAAQSTAQTWQLRIAPTRIVRMVNAAKGIQVSWERMPSATGYVLYRKKNNDTHWTRARTITNGKSVVALDTGVKNGVNYRFMVATLYAQQNRRVNSSGKQFYRLTAPRVRKPVSVARGKVKAVWKRNKSANRYLIRYSRSKSLGTAKPIRVSGKALSKLLVQVARGRVYYLQVRAVRVMTGGMFFSSWSPTQSIRVHR